MLEFQQNVGAGKTTLVEMIEGIQA